MSEKNTIMKTRTLSSKNKIKVDCSTPERQNDSPSRDSDGQYDSDSASPINFLFSQDVGVVWNDYTPKSGKFSESRIKNSTPVSSKSRKSTKSKIIEQPLPKRQSLRLQRRPQFWQELLELNKNLQSFTKHDSKNNTDKSADKTKDEDISEEISELSSKKEINENGLVSRKNSNFDNITGIEFDFDDSTNEDLLKVSQKVEEKLLNCKPTPAKRSRNGFSSPKTLNAIKDIDQTSMDAILSNIQVDSPIVKQLSKSKVKVSPHFNDTFDSFDGYLNDSNLDNLIQKPSKTVTPCRNGVANKDNRTMCDHESPSTFGFFARHSSMPESPITELVKPSTSSVGFNRHKSMPHEDKSGTKCDPDSSPPMRCTPEEIKKKHQLAREKLLAKRQLPFTMSVPQKPLVSPENQRIPPMPLSSVPKKPTFQPKVPSNTNCMPRVSSMPVNNITNVNTNNINYNKSLPITQTSKLDPDVKSIIEKKRQEALLRLRQKQQQRVALK